MKKVVVAIDGSEASREVVDYALYYANREVDVKVVFLGRLLRTALLDWARTERVPAAELADVGYSQCGCDRWPSVLAHGDQIVGSTRAMVASCSISFMTNQFESWSARARPLMCPPTVRSK